MGISENLSESRSNHSNNLRAISECRALQTFDTKQTCD
jgi:hypothetical protein